MWGKKSLSCHVRWSSCVLALTPLLEINSHSYEDENVTCAAGRANKVVEGMAPGIHAEHSSLTVWLLCRTTDQEDSPLKSQFGRVLFFCHISCFHFAFKGVWRTCITLVKLILCCCKAAKFLLYSLGSVALIYSFISLILAATCI